MNSNMENTSAFQIPYPFPSIGIFPQDFPEDVSTDEDDDTFSRGRRKKKVVKPSEKNSLEKVKGKTKSAFLREMIICPITESIRYCSSEESINCCLERTDLYCSED